MRAWGHTICAALACAAVSAPALALELNLPAASTLTAERVTPLGSFDAPVGVFAADGLPVQTIEGVIDRRAWRISTGGLTSLQVMSPLRAQLDDLGYRIVFECDAAGCGGFDFRFAAEVLPGPNMYVNLSQYRYLTAFMGPADAPSEAVGVLVSVADASAYVQIIHADSGGALPERDDAGAAGPDAISPVPPDISDIPDLERQLRRNGRIILPDLEFATGTSDLGAGPYPSLTQLARMLLAQPAMRLALVGHTDTTGSLEANVAVSRARAASVRQRLIDDYSVPEAQLDAEGMGYLAPVASNLTAEGRERNRRVEAVLLSAE